VREGVVTGQLDQDQRIRDQYEHSPACHPSGICHTPDPQRGDFTDIVLAAKFSLVRQYYRGGRLVDLGCATGLHLAAFAEGVQSATGVDFTARYLDEAQRLLAAKGAANVTLVRADARRLPFQEGAVGHMYSFSSLYAIPRVTEVIAEVGRVLAAGGCAVLEIGNPRSLNAVCVKYYTEWPPLYLAPLAEIKQALAMASLEVVEHRCFQLLPLWADRPRWLWPLLHPAWKAVLQRQWRGRMWDERISSLPGLRALAFRHVMVCRKMA
jgi:SAM-dependent methyltransferase